MLMPCRMPLKLHGRHGGTTPAPHACQERWDWSGAPALCRTPRRVHPPERTRWPAALAAELGQNLPPALQKIIEELRHTARHGTLALVGCLGSNLRRCRMRRREFIAGLGSAATWPLVVRAQQGPLRTLWYTLHSVSAFRLIRKLPIGS
jgi:hypothetical protein